MDTSGGQVNIDSQLLDNRQQSSPDTSRHNKKCLRKEASKLRNLLAQSEREKAALRAKLVSAQGTFEHFANL